jgi:hypothetical protein
LIVALLPTQTAVVDVLRLAVNEDAQAGNTVTDVNAVDTAQTPLGLKVFHCSVYTPEFTVGVKVDVGLLTLLNVPVAPAVVIAHWPCAGEAGVLAERLVATPTRPVRFCEKMTAGVGGVETEIVTGEPVTVPGQPPTTSESRAPSRVYVVVTAGFTTNVAVLSAAVNAVVDVPSEIV